ncbi:MAG TPA: hypothetical protein VF582_03210 [Allosphingosinicella sp.]|jgi:hypothetical protein
MRNPARKALYCLLALAAGVALVRLGVTHELRVGEHWTSIVPLLIGFAVAPFALFMLIQALFAARGQALLLTGHKVIANWHVHPAEWEQFRKLDACRSAEHVSFANELWIRGAAPAEGVGVIVGEKSLLVDGSYHVLRPGGLPDLREVRWLAGPPTCLEFAIQYPRRSGGPHPLTVRIPVPAAARGLGQRIIDHFEPRLRRKPPLALRNSQHTYRVCAVLLAAAIAAGAAGYVLGSDLPEGGDPLVPLGLLVGGTIMGVFAAIVALGTFVLTRRR